MKSAHCPEIISVCMKIRRSKCCQKILQPIAYEHTRCNDEQTQMKQICTWGERTCFVGGINLRVSFSTCTDFDS